MSQDPIKFCKNILKDVSRSFALTIPMLDKAIYKPVMITYLQDRLLDNFEDEGENISLSRRKYLMDKVVEIFNPSNSNPESAINEIENNSVLMPDKSLKKLTENAGILRKAFNSMDEEVKVSSYKWLLEMNKGMQKYLSKEVETFADLDEYCYYVAGTVGGFLTDMIILKGKTSEQNRQVLHDNFNDAGLFLQKVNLIRDIKKDIEGRDKNFWPLKSLGLRENMLLDRTYKEKTMIALNKMLDNVKIHVKGLVDYMEAIPSEFTGYKRFFAVNNALGLATLEKMENNPDLFYGNRKVKVPKIEFLKILKSPEKNFYKKSNLYKPLSKRK